MRVSARLVFGLLVSFLLIFFVVTPLVVQTHAQTTDAYHTPVNDTNVPKNLNTYTQNVMIEVMAAISCQVTGIDPTNVHAKCLGADPNTGKIGFVQNGGGAIGATGAMIGMFMTPPVYVGQYTHYLAQNYGVGHAEAADPRTPGVNGVACNSTKEQNTGSGFCMLSPLISIWTVFRNLVYLMFTIVFLFLGVAIMLRVKIDPRTVMSIQSVLPQVIIGLILITFSYAIAAFVIDLMYGVTYFATNIISTADKNVNFDPGTGYEMTTSTSPLEAANHISNSGVATFAAGPSGNIGDALSPYFNNDPGKLITGVIAGYFGFKLAQAASKTIAAPIIKSIATAIGCAGGAVVGDGVGTPAGCILGLQLGDAISGIFGVATGVAAASQAGTILTFVSKIIIFLILTISLLWALLRVWFVLLTSYIYILFDVVLGPFWILMGVLPGGRAGISGWLRDLSSHVAVFPATIIMFLLGRIFVDAFATGGNGIFVAPMIGAFNPATLGSIIGMGIIFATPEVLNLTRSVFKAPKVELGGGFGKAIGVGTGVVGAGTRGTWGRLWRPADYYHNAGPLRGLILRNTEKLDERGFGGFIRSAAHGLLGRHDKYGSFEAPSSGGHS